MSLVRLSRNEYVPSYLDPEFFCFLFLFNFRSSTSKVLDLEPNIHFFVLFFSSESFNQLFAILLCKK